MDMTVGTRVEYLDRDLKAVGLGVIAVELGLPAGLYECMVQLDDGRFIRAAYSRLNVVA